MKKRIFNILGLLLLGISGMAQVDNAIEFDVNFNDDFHGQANLNFEDHSTYNLKATTGNVLLGKGRYGQNTIAQSAQFTGTNISYITYSNPEHLTNDGDFSISIWYAGGSAKITDSELLISKFDLKVSLEENNTPSVSGIVDQDWKQHAYDASKSIFNTGYRGWQHLVIIKKNDSLYLYRNNILRGSGKYLASQSSSSENLVIGKEFKGFIDHITIYKGVISKEEINYLFSKNQEVTEEPANCIEDIFFSPVGVTFNEGNVFSSCIGSAGDYFITSDLSGYNLIEGKVTLQYPSGVIEILGTSQFYLEDFGVYHLTFQTSDNCVIEKEFEILPKIVSELSFAKEQFCTGTEDYIDLELPIKDITKNINGEPKKISFDLYKDQELIGSFSAKDSKLSINSGGSYQVKVNYEGCINNTLWSNTLLVSETACHLTGVLNIDEKVQLNIYPNPASGALFIDNIESGTDITIITSLGESTKAKVKGNTLDLSGYKPGVYKVLISTKTGIVSERIVIE